MCIRDREDREVESRSRARSTGPPRHRRKTKQQKRRRKRRQLVAVEAVDKKALDESKKACSLLGDASRAIAAASNEDAWEKRGEKQVALGDAWQKSGLAKASSVAAYALDLLQNAGTKILVFAHHKSVMDALEQNLVRGLKGAKAMMRIDGTTAPRERQRLVLSLIHI